jgi:hypothetical protein
LENNEASSWKKFSSGSKRYIEKRLYL